MPEAVPFSLPFEEAIAFFASKGFAVSPESWRDVWQDANAHSFTVARVTAMDVLQDLKAEVDKALTEGVSLEQFKKDLIPNLARKGWFAPKGEAAKVELPDGTIRKRLTPWRLETIWRTNIQTAYSVGRYRQMTEPAVAEARPYWQYKAIMDRVTRPNHAAMNNKVYDHRHPIWNTWYPPNGFHCRCYVKTLSVDQVRERGLQPGIDPPGAFEPDEGWRYNPGQAGLDAWQPDWNLYPDVLLRSAVRQGVTSPVFERFLSGASDADFPVAVLDEAYRGLIGASVKTVSMSAESLTKNRAEHPDLSVEDYKRIPDVVERAETIIQDGARTLVFLKVAERIFHAVVKATESGEGLFLTSYRTSNRKDIERARRRGKVLKDEL